MAELLREHPEDALAGDREAIERRILDGAHLGLLRRIVEGDTAQHGVLRTWAAVEGDALPRGVRTAKAEARLAWLGVIKDGGAKSWGWVAPAMRAFAGEWSCTLQWSARHHAYPQDAATGTITRWPLVESC